MTNLLQETLSAIEDSGHLPSDIVYIGNIGEGERYSCTWADFTTLADVEYDAGYGAAEVAQGLGIMFGNGGRKAGAEDGGAEGWEHVAAMGPPSDRGKPIATLVGQFWPSLSELHDPADDHHKAAR